MLKGLAHLAQEESKDISLTPYSSFHSIRYSQGNVKTPKFSQLICFPSWC